MRNLLGTTILLSAVLLPAMAGASVNRRAPLPKGKPQGPPGIGAAINQAAGRAPAQVPMTNPAANAPGANPAAVSSGQPAQPGQPLLQNNPAAVPTAPATAEAAPVAGVLPPMQGMLDTTPSAETTVSALDLKTMRDPFKQLVSEKTILAANNEIETIPVDQFRLVAVLTGPSRIRALLRGPEGRLFTVFQGETIGNRGGHVRRIEEDRVVVQESVVDVLGERETVTTEIPLQPEKSVLAAATAAIAAGGAIPGQPTSTSVSVPAVPLPNLAPAPAPATRTTPYRNMYKRQ